jgi:hypothetical protein
MRLVVRASRAEPRVAKRPARGKRASDGEWGFACALPKKCSAAAGEQREARSLLRSPRVGAVPLNHRIELALLRDGNLVTLSGGADHEGGPHVRVAHTPGETLRVIEQALEQHTDGPVALAVRSAESPLLTWTTPSSTLALFWLSTILGQPFQPGFVAKPTVEPRESAPRLAPPQQQVA